MINAIFAMDEAGGMGYQGKLPWGLNRKDLNWFKANTIDSIVVMGRGTWESKDMPSPLPKRTNWVVTSGTIDPVFHGAQLWNGDPYELCLKLEKENPKKAIWVIGGAKLLMSMAGKFDRMYVSYIYGNYNCDTYIDFAKLSEGYKEIYCDADFELDHKIYAKLSPTNVQNPQ